MKIHHFYHVFAAGAWEEPVREHIEALGGAEFKGSITIGLVGTPDDCSRTCEMIMLSCNAVGIDAPDTWLETGVGFEQFTLTALRNFALDCKDECAVLYAHTKGALENSSLNTCWRQSMTRRVIGDWRTCIKLLASKEYDTIGCHWLTPAEYHTSSSYYGGNFWWARSGYLRTLPPLKHDNRWDAEVWVGLGHPRAYDLLPGWPSTVLCGL